MPNEVHRRGPAALWHHDHPPVRNVNDVMRERMSLGQRVADRVATAVGSWPFIIAQSMLLFAWIVLNVWLLAMVHAHPGFPRAWDPYPFILLNLMPSFQAASRPARRHRYTDLERRRILAVAPSGAPAAGVTNTVRVAKVACA